MSWTSRRPDLPSGGFADWEIPATTAAVRAFLATHTIPGFDADDVLHEALTAWWEARSAYDERRGASPRTFLNLIVRRHLTDLLRSATSQGRGRDFETLSFDSPLASDDLDSGTLHDVVDGTLEDSDPDRALEPRLRAEALAQVRARLSPEDQLLFDSMKAGRGGAEIARLLDVPPSTVRSRKAVLLRKLRTTELRDFLG